MMLDITYDVDGWLAGIPVSQSSAICDMIKSGRSEEDVAELWLSTAGAATTAGFGTSGSIQNFYSNLKAEFISFVCGSPKYNDERSAAGKLWSDHGKTALVSFVAVSIAPVVGLAAAAIIPVVGLLFTCVGKMGINAFCASCEASSSDVPF